MNNKKSKAFTLIEISIVILVIGILIAAIARGGDLLKNAKLAAAKSVTQSSVVNSMDSLLLWLETTSNESFSERVKDGQAVTYWNDINPQITPKNKVECVDSCGLYTRDIINGLPAIRFRYPAVNGYYNVTLQNIANSSKNTFFFVVRAVSETINYIFDNASGTGQYTLVINPDPDSIYGYGFAMHGGITIASPIKTAFVDTNYIISAVFNEANSILRYNGNEITGNIGTNKMTKNIKIGKSIVTTQNYWQDYDGYIAEVILFNRVLYQDEIEQVESYLSQKWRIDLK